MNSTAAISKPTAKQDLANFVLFQLNWFAVVIGAANGTLWFGVAVLSVFFVATYWFSANPIADFKLVGIAVFIGLVIETCVLQTGLLNYVQIAYTVPIAPLWILMLWAGFALTLNGCLRWLHGRYALSAALGALGGPASYFGGVKLGAATTDMSLVVVLGMIAGAYAVVTPLLLFIAKRLTGPK